MEPLFIFISELQIWYFLGIYNNNLRWREYISSFVLLKHSMFHYGIMPLLFFLNPPQSGLHLLVSKQPLVCLVHHIRSISSQVLQSHLEWRLWMLLFILAVTLLLAAPVATVLPLLYVPIQNLLLLTKMFLAPSELGLLRLGLIKCRYILILCFFFEPLTTLYKTCIWFCSIMWGCVMNFINFVPLIVYCRSSVLTFHWQYCTLFYFLHFLDGLCFTGPEKGDLHLAPNHCWITVIMVISIMMMCWGMKWRCFWLLVVYHCLLKIITSSLASFLFNFVLVSDTISRMTSFAS